MKKIYWPIGFIATLGLASMSVLASQAPHHVVAKEVHASQTKQAAQFLYVLNAHSAKVEKKHGNRG